MCCRWNFVAPNLGKRGLWKCSADACWRGGSDGYRIRSVLCARLEHQPGQPALWVVYHIVKVSLILVKLGCWCVVYRPKYFSTLDSQGFGSQWYPLHVSFPFLLVSPPTTSLPSITIIPILDRWPGTRMDLVNTLAA